MYEVIGQNELKQDLLSLQKLPQFIILLGPSGSGRTLISKWVAEQYDMKYISVGNKIADIRFIIEDTIALSKPTIYYINNADQLTVQAANAMLKIAEEPPKNLYIILGLSSLENIINTIVSRATIFKMNRYTYEELALYYASLDYEIKYIKELLSCITTPGQIKQALPQFDKCYDYVDLVYNNILKVSTGNSFKISNKIGFNEEENKISIYLFFKVFNEYLRNRLHNLDEDIEKIQKMILYTNEAQVNINRRGANKKLIFDTWVLNIRTLR